MDYKFLCLLAAHMFFKHSETAQTSATHHRNTYKKRRIPVLAKAKARPKIPLPIIALLRLKTDIPREVVPGIWRSKDRRVSNSLARSREMHLCFKLHVLRYTRYKQLLLWKRLNKNWFGRGKSVAEPCHRYTLSAVL